MNLNIKNSQIKKTIDSARKKNTFAMSMENSAMFFSKSSSEQNGLSILWGYIDSLVEIAEFPEVNLELDLTYDTIENMLQVVAYEFSAGMHSDYTKKENIAIVEKTIAAYLTFVAANEHGFKISVEQIPNLFADMLQDKRFWSGYRISLQGPVTNIEFLPAISGMVKFRKGLLTISMNRIMSIYETLTGVDLSKKGLDDFQVQF